MQDTNTETNIDLKLLEKTKAGDKTSYKVLFEKYYPALVRFVYLYVKDEDIAEELVQEFFVQFWIKREQIKINTSVKSYFYKALRNRALNYKRDEKDDLSINSDLHLIDDVQSKQYNDQLDLQLLEAQVKSAVDSLPEKCKKIFRLSRENNLTYKEIAERMNISQKTVEAQVGIALKKLREKLQPIINSLISLIVILF
ncbi:MAG: RNA polymerase sigma-70 factor [Ignavibacteria bacterium]|jgi:RNA polymerase sigma-70 factor (ECF subfamily)